MKNESKIRRLLGNDYHLNTEECFSSDGDTLYTKWKLFRKYNDNKLYFSDDNKAIMTSDNNTEEELLNFAKEHHKYDYVCIHENFRLIVSFIVATFLLANVGINNSYIRAIGLSLDAYVLIDCFISFIVMDHNEKVKMKQWGKDMELLLKEIHKENNKNGSI